MSDTFPIEDAYVETCRLISACEQFQIVALAKDRDDAVIKVRASIIYRLWHHLENCIFLPPHVLKEFRAVHAEPVQFGRYHGLSWHEIAVDVARNLNHWTELTSDGCERLQDFPTREERASAASRNLLITQPEFVRRWKGFDPQRLYACLAFEANRTEERTGGNGTRNGNGCRNRERDEFIVEQRDAGKTWAEVTLAVNSRPGWRLSEDGVRKAYNRMKS